MKLIANNLVLATGTTLTASTSNSRFPVSNLQHYFRSKIWRSTSTTAQVVFDMQTAEPVDSCVILWPKEDGVLISDTAVVKIQANATNVWTSPSVDVTLTLNETYEVMSKFWSTDQEYRYWRVSIVDSGNALGYVALGVVVLGKSEAISSADNGFKYELIDQSKVIRTDFGNEYVDEYPKVAKLSLAFNVLDYTDIELLDAAYRRNGTRMPIYISLDDTDVTFDKDFFAIYGKFPPSVSFDHINYQIFNTTLDIREVL
jgi:hypothetical protein